MEELLVHMEKVEEKELSDLVMAILNAKQIFVAGAGRSGLVIRAFANRLMHLGIRVSVVGEITTPKAAAGDLLIIGSGSGETQSLIAAARNAKNNGVKIAINTTAAQSTLAKLADVLCVLPGVSKETTDMEYMDFSIQPMASSFEQLSFVIYDAIVVSLMKELKVDTSAMFARHANLE